MALKFNNRPLYLKSNEILDVYSIYDIDFLFEKQADYKISFGNEPRDSIYNFRDSTIKGNPDVIFPENIMGYKRYLPKDIISNVIYFSSKEIDKKNSVDKK
jgi:hypothetical protein